jgi:hypothetical protein
MEYRTRFRERVIGHTPITDFGAVSSRLAKFVRTELSDVALVARSTESRSDPDSYSLLMRDAILRSHEVRDLYVDSICWAIPSVEVIEAIRSFACGQKIIEICAGRGFWTRLLELKGVKIFPTDIHPPKDAFTHIQEMDSVTAVSHYNEQCNVLMCVWPAFWNSSAVDALKTFTGRKFIFCGECRGGCTATDDFFDELKTHWKIVNEVNNPTFWGIHDSVRMFVRV